MRLLRPWSVKHLLAVLPKTVKNVAVLEQNSGELGWGVLYRDIVSSLTLSLGNSAPRVISGMVTTTYLTSAMVKSIFQNLRSSSPKSPFSVGLVEEPSSLTVSPFLIPSKAIQISLWEPTQNSPKNNFLSLNLLKNFSDKEDFGRLFVNYDSYCVEGVTKSVIQFGGSENFSNPNYTPKPTLDDIVISDSKKYLFEYNLLVGLKDKGIFIVNGKSKEILETLPAAIKREIARRGIKFFIVDIPSLTEEFFDDINPLKFKETAYSIKCE